MAFWTAVVSVASGLGGLQGTWDAQASPGFGFSATEIVDQVILPTPQDLDADGADDATVDPDPRNRDTDLDRIPDGVELSYGTSPVAWDSDGDLIPDYIEIYRSPTHQLSPAADPDNDSPDTDADGAPDLIYTNLQEYRYHRPTQWIEGAMGPWFFGTQPHDADSDDDGLKDGAEYFTGDLANVPGSHPTVEAQSAQGDDLLPMPGFMDHPMVEDPLTDLDHDGLTMAQEYYYGTDPFNLDTDGDGLCDGSLHALCEARFGADPASSDTDLDGLLDSLEIVRWDTGGKDLDGDGLPGILDPDQDGDGLRDGLEVAHGFLPNVPDSDADRLRDGAEFYAFGTDVMRPDTDGDLLLDGEEVRVLGLVPLDPDQDGDTLLDGLELDVYLTSPRYVDSDSDGMPDAWEVRYHTLPAVFDPLNDEEGDGLPNHIEYLRGVDPVEADTSGDGLPDGWQEEWGLHPAVNNAFTDQDLDGLRDLVEYEAGTNIRLADTDGDLLGDRNEVQVYRTDPLDPDTDDDGLWDGPEVWYWRTLGATAWKTNPTYGPCAMFALLLEHCASNLHLTDADLDGLSDRDEFVVTRTSPLDPFSNGNLVLAAPLSDGAWAHAIQYGALASATDTDGDGVTDAFEAAVMRSSPARVDSDCDGISDGLEYRYWGLDTEAGVWYPWLVSDVDGDAVADGTEINVLAKRPLYPHYTDPARVDMDDDALTDPQETAYRDAAAGLCLLGAASMAEGPFEEALRAIASAPDPGLPTVEELVETPPPGEGLVERLPDAPDPAREAAEKVATDLSGLGLPSLHPLAGGIDVPPSNRMWNAQWPPVTSVVATGAGDVGTVFTGTPYGPGYPPSPGPGPFPGVLGFDVPHPGPAGADSRASGGASLFEGLETDPSLRDSDLDGVDDGTEADGGTHPLLCDSDGDGLGDGLELGAPVHASTMATPCYQFDRDGGATVTDALSLDTDGDGVPDGQEDVIANGVFDAGNHLEADPNLVDTDGDTLPDLDEFLAAAGTAFCTNVLDCDVDGLQDHVDPSAGLFMADNDQDGAPNYLDPDMDGDGVLFDSQEGFGGSTPHSDTDGDGLWNVVDMDSDDDWYFDGREIGTAWLNPAVPDLDGDGLRDGRDLEPNIPTPGQIFNVDFGSVALLDAIDYESDSSGHIRKTYKGEIYVRSLAVAKEPATADSDPIFEIDPSTTPAAPFGTTVATSARGRIADLSGLPWDLGIPHKLEPRWYSYEAGGDSVGLYLFVGAADADDAIDPPAIVPNNDDILDINAVDGQRRFEHEIDLATDDWGGRITMGGDDGSGYGGPHEDDARIYLGIQDLVSADMIVELLTFSCAHNPTLVHKELTCTGPGVPPPPHP